MVSAKMTLAAMAFCSSKSRFLRFGGRSAARRRVQLGCCRFLFNVLSLSSFNYPQIRRLFSVNRLYLRVVARVFPALRGRELISI